LRDGGLFDRTVMLGYGRCPRGLSASNSAASQAADAFPSLKKPTQLFDVGQLAPGVPLLLSSIRRLIDQSARLKNEYWAVGDFWGPLGNETRAWLDFLSTGRPSVHATPEQAMLNLKTTYAIERAVATGQAVRLD
jgi:hypothetical protein